MFDFAGVMGYAVLMSMEWSGTRCNVGRWDNVQEILVGNEVFFWSVECRERIMGEHTFIGNLKRIIERLYNFREMRPK
jgi:hypothetical protein